VAPRLVALGFTSEKLIELDDVFEQKNDIAKSVERELEKAMFAYGYAPHASRR
jgi:hypothetical protein